MLSRVQRDERLDVAGLREHVERLHDAEPVSFGRQKLQIPGERCRIAREIPDCWDAAARLRASVASSLPLRGGSRKTASRALAALAASRSPRASSSTAPGLEVYSLGQLVELRVGDAPRQLRARSPRCR